GSAWFSARLGSARLGSARLGSAWFSARLGSARLGSRLGSVLGSARVRLAARLRFTTRLGFARRLQDSSSTIVEGSPPAAWRTVQLASMRRTANG
uniref:Uncharacterized protein n=1 Tax=Cucumis melo TaxID=3656 RepID=A0A9I9E3M5_CUCME